MKKGIALLLCLVMLVPLAACDVSRCKTPGIFYYRRTTPVYGSGEGLIAPEKRELCSYREDYAGILESYFSGPQSRGLESPFPRDLKVSEWSLTDTALLLNFNDAFTSLSGVDLTVACSCIARTFLELLPVDQVILQAGRKPLNGQRTLVLTRDNLNFSDDSLAQLRTNYTLYYTDRQRRYLIGVDTSVSLADREDVIRYLIHQLMTAPYHSDLTTPIPYGTQLLDVSAKGGVCTLNFSSEFVSHAWPEPEAQRAALLSIVNTLTQIEGIHQVEFSTEGDLLVQYGFLNISAPFVFEEQAIGPVRSGINEFDTTLYLSNGSERYLTGIPLKIRKTPGLLAEELILQALISYKPLNGFFSPVPSSTRINRVVTENGICSVDFSKDFLLSPGQLAMAVHAVVASVSAVDGINGVRITVEGEIPEGYPPDLFDTLCPRPDWFF